MLQSTDGSIDEVQNIYCFPINMGTITKAQKHKHNITKFTEFLVHKSKYKNNKKQNKSKMSFNTNTQIFFNH